MVNGNTILTKKKVKDDVFFESTEFSSFPNYKFWIFNKRKCPFFWNFQNKMIKCFQNVSIQEKMIKIDKTRYKRKLLSPKFFSKNQNWILKSRPKFSNFQKMAILRKWKYPIFVLKVYKIKKLRQLFLSKCPDGFLRFFDIFLKFKKKKNGEKSPAKVIKSTKLRQFLMSILKGLK